AGRGGRTGCARSRAEPVRLGKERACRAHGSRIGRSVRPGKGSSRRARRGASAGSVRRQRGPSRRSRRWWTGTTGSACPQRTPNPRLPPDTSRPGPPPAGRDVVRVTALTRARPGCHSTFVDAFSCALLRITRPSGRAHGEPVLEASDLTHRDTNRTARDQSKKFPQVL